MDLDFHLGIQERGQAPIDIIICKTASQYLKQYYIAVWIFKIHMITYLIKYEFKFQFQNSRKW